MTGGASLTWEWLGYHWCLKLCFDTFLSHGLVNRFALVIIEQGGVLDGSLCF